MTLDLRPCSMTEGQYWLSAKPAWWKRDKKSQRESSQCVFWGFLLDFLFGCLTPLHYWNWHVLKVNIAFPPFRRSFLPPCVYVRDKKTFENCHSYNKSSIIENMKTSSWSICGWVRLQVLCSSVSMCLINFIVFLSGSMITTVCFKKPLTV